MSDTEYSSAGEELGQALRGQIPAPAEKVETTHEDQGNTDRVHPLTGDHLSGPWVDMDKVRPPPDYERAMQALCMGPGETAYAERAAPTGGREGSGPLTGHPDRPAWGTPWAPAVAPPPGFHAKPILPPILEMTGESQPSVSKSPGPVASGGMMGSGREGEQAQAPWLLTEKVLDEWVESLAPTREASPAGEEATTGQSYSYFESDKEEGDTLLLSSQTGPPAHSPREGRDVTQGPPPSAYGGELGEWVWVQGLALMTLFSIRGVVKRGVKLRRLPRPDPLPNSIRRRTTTATSCVSGLGAK
jgi:hypothetical protein